MLLLQACAYHPPAETPALLAAAEPIRTLPIAVAAVQVGLRAGSAYDPPGREGLAWVTARAIADAAGASVEVGPEIVLFSTSADRSPALAQALAAPPPPERVDAARTAAAATLLDLDCASLASRAWDTWIYLGHPYGHAPEGRLSVLPTLTTEEVAGFQQLRYLRSVAILGVPPDTKLDPSPFDALPPRLSRSPTPATPPALAAQQVLLVRAEDQRCLLVGHPVAEGPEISRGTWAERLHGARLDARHVAFIPIPPERDAPSMTADALGGGWLPLWGASRVLATEASSPIFDALLALPPYPSLARPASATDPTSAGWLDPIRQRAVVVLDPSVPFESSAFSVVQPATTATELFR